MSAPSTATSPVQAPYDLPPELLIETGVARRIIGEFIRGHLQQTGFERIVLALSGGLDSALVAYLVAEAIGAKNLLCVLMPYRTSSPESRAHAEEVVRILGCESELIDITPIVDGCFESSIAGEEVAVGRRGNFAARARMAVVYDRSVPWVGLVCGTSNKTEALLGYTTIYGDSAAALMPIGDLYKTQVRQLAAEMGIPEAILRKPPTADLWPDQTDETEIGMSYADVDRLLYWMVDRRRTRRQLLGMGFDEADVDRVAATVAASEFKRQTPPVAKLTTRTPGVDYLYPRRRPKKLPLG
jgi:NAD+ synthase